MGIQKSVFLMFFLAFFMVSCASNKAQPTFAEAHDGFQTELVRLESDDDEIPPPPEGVFDLVAYPSKVGDLAAYVSSDPGDGERHPMIIWVVGGWGNGIDDFPWSYASWDNDQTASAFWKAGVLTMYPSFRGGNGNPGNYEALFGEIDDIVSAYEYAASLPYVDPERIYLGGHSTGGTRALLASEYTDKFRAVFCFGAVDEVKYHNNDQFTFDTEREEEFTMRSPIHWLADVKTPTFLIEGSEGNSANLKRLQEKSDNENIKCYIIDGADHFSVLAPITEVLAQKILEDTGDEVNITLTQDELQQAMEQEPKEPMPIMTQFENAALGLSLSYPYQWEVHDLSDDEGVQFGFYASTEEGNIWDMSTVYVDVFTTDTPDFLGMFRDYLQEDGYAIQDTEISGYPAFVADGVSGDSTGSRFHTKILTVQKEEFFFEFDFYIHESFGNSADPLFQEMMDSIVLS